VASFDLPAHGERVDRHGSSIAGLCNRVVAGMHPFDDFVAEGKLALDALLERKWGVPGEVVVCGVSRAGYCALRLAAADPRVAGVAAFAPVTDWGELREFAAVREDPKVTALKLVNFVTGLAGRRIYIAIGSADDRVSTVACTQVTLALLQAEAAAGLKRSQLRFVIADDTVGHALANRCRVEGVQFLLKGGSVSGSSSLP
jgi:dienelactone hydrolase